MYLQPPTHPAPVTTPRGHASQVPEIATKYYEKDDPFMFNSFCTVTEPDEVSSLIGARPKLETLYDVFVNVRSPPLPPLPPLPRKHPPCFLRPLQVRNDEREHWKTLCNLVQYDDTQVCSLQRPCAVCPAVPCHFGSAPLHLCTAAL